MSEIVLAVSTGCPASIGPEISVRASMSLASLAARLLLIGDLRVLQRAADLVGFDRERLVMVASIGEAVALPRDKAVVWSRPLTETELDPLPTPGKPDPACGRAQLAYVDEALRLARTGEAAAMVTAAVSKHAIATSGAPGSAHFRGHTEHLAEVLGAPEVVMAFTSGKVITSLVTTHLPIRLVPDAITAGGVSTSTFHLTRLLVSLGVANPRVAICGLNPHAGEDGLIGQEEIESIGPGIDLARHRLAEAGIEATLLGPLGAETAYRRAVHGGVDGVVAMFHDQATIPLKVLSFGEAVNITLGLPVIRTSVDHGTGYDIAGTGKADASGMISAIELASRLARARSASS